ncbi:MAG: Fe(2+)-trafficking protein [Tepidisphaeraceae bacterium]
MADTSDRIEQFKKMAADDPNNELGHFSLARAYLDAGQHAEAVCSFERVVAINPNLSKSYQLMADALLKLNRRDEAIARLTEGVKVADARGDLMPRNDMVRVLRELGAAVPEVSGAKTAAPPVGEGQVRCKRCGEVKPRLPKAPFKGKLGEDIYANICPDCWREGIGMGTKVINELRLPMTDPQAQKMWDQHIREFLNLT